MITKLLYERLTRLEDAITTNVRLIYVRIKKEIV